MPLEVIAINESNVANVAGGSDASVTVHKNVVTASSAPDVDGRSVYENSEFPALVALLTGTRKGGVPRDCLWSLWCLSWFVEMYVEMSFDVSTSY